jgi:RNA polymerase sigma-70 factor, ECF subfamily
MSTFEEIYRTYSEDVYRFSCWLCGDRIEAEDIVSETFVRLWGSRDSLQVETMKAYLLTIARNVYVSRRRRSSRYEPLSDSPQDKSPSPDEEAETKEELGVLKSAIAELPEGERTAFLMRTKCELSYEEIARALGISLSAAKVRVHRSRMKLSRKFMNTGD